MSRIVLAFSCWFRILLGKPLRPEVAKLLPEPPKALPVPERKPEPENKPETKPAPSAHRDGALALLALLQREGRFVDFVREPLDTFSDAEIGAAARDVHRGCRKVIEQHLKLEAVMPGAEEDKVSAPKDFDPA